MNYTNNHTIIVIAIIIILGYTIYYNMQSIEGYPDPYSLYYHSDSVNRMKWWNLMHSRRTSNINYILPKLVYQKCYHLNY